MANLFRTWHRNIFKVQIQFHKVTGRHRFDQVIRTVLATGEAHTLKNIWSNHVVPAAATVGFKISNDAALFCFFFFAASFIINVPKGWISDKNLNQYEYIKCFSNVQKGNKSLLAPFKFTDINYFLFFFQNINRFFFKVISFKYNIYSKVNVFKLFVFIFSRMGELAS